MKTLLKCMALIAFGLIMSATMLITFPLLLLYVGAKLIGGIASKIN